MPTAAAIANPISISIPGIWRHGDFFKVNARGGCFVLGRSDATLNRHGVRIGTAEVYRSLLERAGDRGRADRQSGPAGRRLLHAAVRQAARTAQCSMRRSARGCAPRMRSDYSPRHVPDEIYAVNAIPYTLTGKKMEVPVRRILMGVPPEKAANRAAMANVESLDYFIEYAREQQDYRLTK